MEDRVIQIEPDSLNYEFWSPLHRQRYDERVAAQKEFHAGVSALKFPYPEPSIGMHPDKED